MCRNMKTILLLAIFAAACVAKPANKYSDKFDHINVEEVLESQRLLKSYVDCLMERGRCTPDAKELRTTIPDALETGCSKCTPKQNENSDKVLRFLVNKRKDLWDELSTKYDPDHKYAERFKDKIEKVKDN